MTTIIAVAIDFGKGPLLLWGTLGCSGVYCGILKCIWEYTHKTKLKENTRRHIGYIQRHKENIYKHIGKTYNIIGKEDIVGKPFWPGIHTNP
jgi:hypothetical protein